MGFIAYLVLGLIAGAIAKAILPGKQGGGLIATLVIGVIGALLGGWIGGAVFGADMNEFFSISTWLCAIGGSLIVLVVWGFISRKMSKSKTKTD
ncbi:GlsB/YeaQ/YmgE family stress response membrane protein [Brevibacterium marinum]|uniref:Putative membrane protein YeaQ/YmgE (Transglycosylase-associated protein family) n=1 Tax=Brevibacterium marinum TaxID=418643 RepID=A0A846RPQ7_9MICO|nr:GlsB/YeaQ/YmgE family stress response membrane protein [Brevibacterium marinum]NJC55924.1 putative membrane protein YeaQ/YmgE (transglycosylase-associated protein family) [Brevibacterium marinum]